MMGTSNTIGGRFEIGAYISQGGMGTVYRGLDTQTGETVAIKHLNQDVVASDPDLITRFEREGEILRTLNHPNIVKMLAMAHTETQHYLIMEYVGGGSLADLLHTQKQLPVRQALDIALDLSDALIRTHRLNILHRDLKPANVLIAEDGTPRLTDFGVARRGKSDLTGLDQLVGTAAYLSPEALNGEALDERADIWAFGVMLFEMLVGQRPFEGDSFASQMKGILSDPIPDLEALRPDLPVALIDLVYRMLEKDRQQRISSVRLVGAELESILNGSSSSLRVAQPVQKPGLHDEAPAPVTPTPAADRPLHNLPSQPTPFVGREEELSGLARLLSDDSLRLITILGPGGMGKTRLSLEAAGQQISAFADGVYFVALAPLTAPELILPAIADAVRFTFYEGGTPKDQLIDYLREKQMLLVLDNFEHLLGGTALVSEILQNAPAVRVLATSRERLNLQSEMLLLLDGMDFPDWETPEDAAAYSAVKLFLQSAHRIQPDFALSADNIAYVARICRLVQGVPLGIVLAAAWIGMLTLPEIASEIERSMDFLESDLRDLPERQRSLRAVFDYSWNLLTEDERDVFMKLSVFRGGFTREAAQDVSGASLKTLLGLVNKSLLRRDPAGRYDVHELLRQFAQARLHQMPAVEIDTRNRHSTFYSKFVASQNPNLVDLNLGGTSIEAEFDNVWAALEWAIAEKRSDDLRRVLEAMFMFYSLSRLEEGANTFRRIVEGLRTDHPEGAQGIAYALATVYYSYYSDLLGFPERSRLLHHEGFALLDRLGARYEKAIAGSLSFYCDYKPDNPDSQYAVFQEDLALLEARGNPSQVTLACLCLGRLGARLGKAPDAMKYIQRALEITKGINSKRLKAAALLSAGFGVSLSGNYAAALDYGRQANQIWIEIYKFPLPPLIALLTRMSVAMGAYAEADKAVREAIAVSQQLGNRRLQAALTHDLGWLAWLWHGDFDKANAILHEALTLRREIDDKGGTADTLSTLAWLMCHNKQFGKAREALDEAMKLRNEIGDFPQITHVLNLLAFVALSEGDMAQAQQKLEEALRTTTQQGYPLFLDESLIILGMLKRKAGELEQAVELFSCGLNFPTQLYVTNTVFTSSAASGLSELESELAPERFAAARARGKALNVKSFVSEFHN